MTIKRLDHVSVVVDDLAPAIAFFTALGMTIEGEAPVEGPWVDRVDWNAELVRGDLGKAVQQLKRESGKGLFVAGVKLPLALTELGLM